MIDTEPQCTVSASGMIEPLNHSNQPRAVSTFAFRPGCTGMLSVRPPTRGFPSTGWYGEPLRTWYGADQGYDIFGIQPFGSKSQVLESNPAAGGVLSNIEPFDELRASIEYPASCFSPSPSPAGNQSQLKALLIVIPGPAESDGESKAYPPA